MNDKKIVAILFAGQSAEREVSIRSAQHVQNALLSAGFETLLIGIDRGGVWRLAPRIAEPQSNWPVVVMLPGMAGKILVPDNPVASLRIDVVFPVLHGPFGEDGSVQGLLRLCQVPFVGCDVLSGALCMDKVMAKRMLNAAGLPTAASQCITRDTVPTYTALTQKLGDVIFIKPANMGSSIGVSRVDSVTDYSAALDLAFTHDWQVLAESEIVGREIECAVLSDNGLNASVPGEIITSNKQFYSYEAKYIVENGACLSYPANLPSRVADNVKALSVAAASALGCEGLVRVDFFLQRNGTLVINELNTMPGFTEISMYPKLWNASGRTSANVARILVKHAFDRFARQPGTARLTQQKSTSI